jgi:hypothetical protein
MAEHLEWKHFSHIYRKAGPGSGTDEQRLFIVHSSTYSPECNRADGQLKSTLPQKQSELLV